MNTAEGFDKIAKDLITCTQCLQLLHPLVNGRGAKVLNGTMLANVTIRIRDALIHEAILCLTRVLDKPGTDRVCLEKLIGKLDSSSITTLTSIRVSQKWTNLQDIRNGRIAHNLDQRGGEVCCKDINNIRDDLLKLVHAICPDTNLPTLKDETVKAWNVGSKQFWETIFSTVAHT